MDSESSDLTPDAGSYDIFTGMRDWRLQHPNATLTEIERALDECWHRLRARMLEDLALQHETSAWQASAVDHPTCPHCGRPLIRRGRQPRQLKPTAATPSCQRRRPFGSSDLLVIPVAGSHFAHRVDALARDPTSHVHRIAALRASAG